MKNKRKDTVCTQMICNGVVLCTRTRKETVIPLDRKPIFTQCGIKRSTTVAQHRKVISHRAVATCSIGKYERCHRIAVGGEAAEVSRQVTFCAGVVISELAAVVEGEVQHYGAVTA